MRHRAQTLKTLILTSLLLAGILVSPVSLVAASTEPLVLSILSQGESYGYAIIQRVRQVSKETLQWTDGMLYPVLHRLERGGLIAAVGSSDVTSVRRFIPRIDGRIRNARSLGWSLQLDRELIDNLFLRAGYQQRRTTRNFLINPTIQ